MTTVAEFREVHIDENTTVVIPATTTTSPLYDCGGSSICALQVDEQLSGKTLTFLVGQIPNKGVLYPFVDPTGANIGVVCPAISSGQKAVIQIPPGIFAGIRFVRVVASGAVATDSIMTFFVRPV